MSAVMTFQVSVRHQAQHIRRMKSIEKLLAALETRVMSTTEIAELLCLSWSGARSLRNGLLDAGVLEVDHTEEVPHGGGPPKMFFRLGGSPELRGEFMEALQQGYISLERKAAAPSAAPKLMPGTRIIMAEDESNRPRRNAKVNVHRDPFDCVFFGMPGAKVGA